MPKIYKNREYIDFIRDGEFSNDTQLEGGDLVTQPEKVQIRDMGLFIYGIFAGATVIAEYSPDFMETKVDDLVPATMRWFSRDDGSFTSADLTPVNIWENFDTAEGWLRFRVINVAAQTDVYVKTRPRVEATV